MEVKPGWQTTEFWISLGTNLVSLLVALGIVAMQDGASIQGAIVSAVTAAFALISAAVIVWKYVQSRTAAKVAVTEAHLIVRLDTNEELPKVP